VDAQRAQWIGDDRPDYCEAAAELVQIEGIWFSVNRGFIEGIGDSMGRDGS